MILILLYRFDTVNSFLALYFIISNLIIVLFLIKFNYLYVKFLINQTDHLHNINYVNDHTTTTNL